MKIMNHEDLCVWHSPRKSRRLFQRLWCNYELAVHAKTSISTKNIHFVPMWTAMWCLCWLGMYVIIGLSLYGTTVSTLDVDANSPYISMSVSLWNMYAIPLPSFFVLAIALSYFCFHKLDEHKSMLEQMAHFDVRNAKCTLETDRRVIEEQVSAPQKCNKIINNIAKWMFFFKSLYLC